MTTNVPARVRHLEVDSRRCASCGSRFARLNLAVNVALTVLKATVGLLAGSKALVASALYSFNDVLSALAVLASLGVARRPANKSYPFGYGKVEYIAIGLVGLMLAASVLFLVHSVTDTSQEVIAKSSTAVALGVAGLSFGVSLLLAKKGFCVAARQNSPALHTSAEHNHIDAIASLAVFVSIAGILLLDLHVLDRIVAAFEALDVARLAGTLLGRSWKGLMDSALPAEDQRAVRKAFLRVQGVEAIASLRSRSAGAHVMVDVRVAVSGERSVEQAHEICERVRAVVPEVLGPNVRAQVGFRGHTPQTPERLGNAQDTERLCCPPETRSTVDPTLNSAVSAGPSGRREFPHVRGARPRQA